MKAEVRLTRSIDENPGADGDLEMLVRISDDLHTVSFPILILMQILLCHD